MKSFTAKYAFALMNGKTVPVNKTIEAEDLCRAREIAKDLSPIMDAIESRVPGSFKQVGDVVFNNANVCAFWLDDVE